MKPLNLTSLETLNRDTPTSPGSTTPRGGVNTATSGQNSAEPADKKPEIGNHDAQDALKAHKPEKEESSASSEIITGLRTMTDPVAPQASKIVNNSAEEVEAAKAALFDIKAATDIKKVDEKAPHIPDASVANSTCPRREKLCCC